MARIAMRSCISVLITILSCSLLPNCTAQVAPGTPAFGSFGGGPFDTVNLGNLNVHFSVPILHKAGRGLPFTYDLSYDSSIWTPVGTSGSQSWQPTPGWGWVSAWTGNGGYVLYSAYILQYCYDGMGHQDGEVQVWNSYVYHDAFGRSHAFSGQIIIYSGGCTGTNVTAFTSTATDGSGLTISVANGTQVYLTTPGGSVLGPPAVQIPPISAQPSTKSDANGNQLTSNASGQFFDTLSSTTPVLTISGTGDPASPITFTYPAPSDGASSCSPITQCASYSMNYTQYTVATDFGVSGIAEYPRTSASLVSSIVLPDGKMYSFTYEKTPGSCTPLSGTYATNCVTGRIASVTLPAGGEVTYTYSGGNNGIESDGSTAGLARTLNPGGEWQYARSLSGSTWTTTVTDPNGNQTAINFAKDGNTTTPTYNFYETRRQVKQLISGTQTLLATVTKCYNAIYANCSTASVSSPITQTDVYSQLPNGSTRLSEVLYNGYGLVTDAKEYNYGVTMGSAPGSTDLVRETAVSYNTSLGNGIVNKPSSVTVNDWTSGTSKTLASTTYAYDGTAVTATSGTPQHFSITGSRGNLTTLTTSTSSTTSLSKTLTYYDTGNPYVATDVNSAQTTYVYSSAANPYNSSLTASCGNSFATSINEPSSLSRSTQWSCIGGIAEQVTDENGQTVKSGYTDSDFWRPANVYDRENNETTISYSGQTAVEAALSFNGGNSVSDSRTTVDGFGRPILRQRLQGPGATNYDTAETDYNSLGQPYRSTMPFSAAAGGTSSTAPSTNTTYDALGRVLTVTDADGGTVTYTYTNNDVLQQVSGGTQTFQKQFEYDGLGRLTSVCEISSTLPGIGTCGQVSTKSGYWTKYTYDALGHLLTVAQNAQTTGSQQNRTYNYDLLGRLTSEVNPESGTTLYYWDAAPAACYAPSGYPTPGDLGGKKNNAGVYTCNGYDALHRLVGSSNTTNLNCRGYVYDSGTPPTGVTVVNTKTRLVEAYTNSTCNGHTSIVTDEWFSYSPRGELTDVYESTPHSSGYYHSNASYWPTGTINSLSAFNSTPTALFPTIYYGASNGAGLDGEGRITKVTAASGTGPVSNVTYSTSSTTNPLGSLTGVTLGSADSDSFTYDPNTGRMLTYSFSVNSQTDAGALTWSPNGTLSKLVINDQIPGTSDSQTCNYLYDDLQRLSSSNCGSLWSQTFTYDSFGNITKNGNSSFIPGYSPTTNQFTSIPGVTVRYDANGNLLTDNLNSYTWDAYGDMATVNNGSAIVTATYDAMGRMVENNAGGTYTQIVYGPNGKKLATANGQTLVKAFIALPGGAKAIYKSTGLAYYRHSDWLGSSRLTSTASQPTSMYFSSAYAPFGEQYATAGTADASFTGQDQDTVSSLYDFPARRQSPSQGRWISPDPAGRAAVNLSNPQTWNRYAYVNNNPLRVIDSTGLCGEVVAAQHGSAHANEGEPCDPPTSGGDDSSGDDSSGDDNSGPGDSGASPPDNGVCANGPTQVGVGSTDGLTAGQLSQVEGNVSAYFQQQTGITVTFGSAGGGTTLDFVNNQDLPSGMSPSLPGQTPYNANGTYPATSYVNTQFIGSLWTDWTQSGLYSPSDGGSLLQGIAETTEHELTHGLTMTDGGGFGIPGIGDNGTGITQPFQVPFSFSFTPDMTTDQVIQFQNATCDFQQGDFGGNQGPGDPGSPDQPAIARPGRHHF